MVEGEVVGQNGLVVVNFSFVNFFLTFSISVPRLICFSHLLTPFSDCVLANATSRITLHINLTELFFHVHTKLPHFGSRWISQNRHLELRRPEQDKPRCSHLSNNRLTNHRRSPSLHRCATHYGMYAHIILTVSS